MGNVRRISFAPAIRVPIVIRVADSQGEREISWRPEGSSMVRFQRLVLAADAGAACTARLVGA